MECSKTLQSHVRSLEIRAGWGCNKSHDNLGNVVTLRDNYIMYCVGCRLFVLDCLENKNSVVNLFGYNVQFIYSFHVSPDLAYAAVCVALAGPNHIKKASVLVFSIDSMLTYSSKPNLIEYKCSSGSYFYTAAFSHCSTLVAVGLSPDGVLVYERFTGNLQHHIPTNGICTRISYYLTDKTRLCLTGNAGLFQFVRCSSKWAKSTSIAGIETIEIYTCHEWLSGDNLVAGTMSGCVYLVSGSSVQRSVAFPGSMGGDDALPVVALLVRNESVIAFSSSNKLIIYDVTSSTAACKLQVSMKIRIGGLTDIVSAKWAMLQSSLNFEMYISSFGAIYVVDLRAGEYESAVLAAEENSGSNINWIDHSIEKTIFSFNSSPLHCLSISAEYNLFVTAGVDSSIRVWNYSSPNSPTVLVDNISSCSKEVPTSVAFHPSGLFVAVACDDSVTEFQITDNKLESVRLCLTKGALISSIDVAMTTSPGNGTRQGHLFNNQPVSQVKYSNGGHLLAAVTGRFLQIFPVYQRDFTNCSTGESVARIRVSDHKAAISDFSFAKDDSSVFSCSFDGSVYGYLIGAQDRNFEFLAKGVAALRIVAGSPSGLVIASFSRDPDALGLQSCERIKISRKSKATGSFASDILDVADNNLRINQDDRSSSRHFLAIWGKSALSTSPQIINTDTSITSIALGVHDLNFVGSSQEYLVMGCIDGRLLVAFLPLPTILFELNLMGPQEYLAMDKVAWTFLHNSMVSDVAVSPNGAWILSAGHDGAVFMTSASVRSRDMFEELKPIQTLVCTDKSAFLSQKFRLDDVDSLIRGAKFECDKIVKEVISNKNEAVKTMEVRMKNEIQKRDELIIRTREEHAKKIRELKEDAKASEGKFSMQLSSLECYYEKKLAQETMYVNKMKQAFDEVLVNSKLDASVVVKESSVNEQRLLKEKRQAVVELENQKYLIKSYCDYVNARNDEVAISFEDTHEEERAKWREESQSLWAALESLQSTAKEDILTLTNTTKDLNAKLLLKDDEIAKVRSDLSWANTRLQKLEEMLLQATNDLEQQKCSRDSWVVQRGEYQQQIRDLELVRQSLTLQLHNRTQDARPQQEKLISTTDELTNVTTQYELSLRSLAENDTKVNIQSERLRLLQKQVSHMRMRLTQKNKILKRVAKVLVNYPDFDEVSSLKYGSSSPDNYQRFLKQLETLLWPYMSDYDGIVNDEDGDPGDVEREKQRESLHRNMNILKSNLDTLQSVSDLKVQNHLRHNILLLKEVNELRKDNHRLITHTTISDIAEESKQKARQDLCETMAVNLSLLSKAQSSPHKSAKQKIDELVYQNNQVILSEAKRGVKNSFQHVDFRVRRRKTNLPRL